MKRTLALLLVLTLCFLSGCGNTAQSSSGSSDSGGAAGPQQQSGAAPSATASPKKDSLTIAVSAEPPNLDAHNHNGSHCFIVDTQIYDNLIVLNNETGEFDLRLAESYELSADGMVVDIKIRKGVMFTNGEELKASDVRFSFHRMLESALVKGKIEGIKECEVIDDYTVKIHMKYPYALTDVVVANCYIVSEKAVTEFGESYGSSAETTVGSGAYMAASWDKGQQLVLTRNDNYFGDKAKIKDVIFKLLPDETTSSMALEKGEIDYIWQVGLEETIKGLEKADGVQIIRGTQFHQGMFIINNSKPPLDNVKVREAISYALDRDNITLAARGDLSVPLKTYLATGTAGNDESVVAPDRDLEKAKALMAEAGYADGFNMQFLVYSGANESFGPVIQANLAEIGIRVEIAPKEKNTVQDLLFAGEFDTSYIGFFNGGDADWMSRFFMSTSSNDMFYFNNARLDELLDQGRQEIDISKRLVIYKEALELLRDNSVTVPLCSDVVHAACSSDLEGVIMPRNQVYQFRTISWK